MKHIVYIFLAFALAVVVACNKHGDVGQPLSGLWQKLNTPYFGRISDIQFTSSDTGYIIGYDTTVPVGSTIIKTFDGGQTWEKIYFPYVVANGDDLQPGGAWLQVSPFNSKILFSMAGGISVVYIIRSDDGGYHWKIIDSTQSGGAWGNYHFLLPAHIIRSGGWIFSSTDSGSSWTKVYDRSGFANFEMLQFPDSETGYTAGGIFFDATDYGLMAKTIDGGNTWQLVNYPFRNILGMSFINDNTGYIVMDRDPESSSSESVLYKTTDGGNTWNAVNKNLNWGGYDLYFRNEQDGFTYGKGGIFRTTDGGQSWRNEFKDTPDNPIFNLCFPNPSCGYAIDENGNVYKRTF